MEEVETFDTALVDVLMNEIMDDLDKQIREKFLSIVKQKDPKALRKFISNLYKSFNG
ncbi:MAG: hypothetical protein FWE53_02365 [Firmicutes bacterium]|nr:hypothetical protein [Bacillota bacterium]